MKKNNITIFMVAAMLATSANASAQTGNVGINTPTPTATLDIKSKGTDNTTKAFRIENSATTPTEMVTVLDNGNVGIGTATPKERFTIN